MLICKLARDRRKQEEWQNEQGSGDVDETVTFFLRHTGYLESYENRQPVFIQVVVKGPQ